MKIRNHIFIDLFMEKSPPVSLAYHLPSRQKDNLVKDLERKHRLKQIILKQHELYPTLGIKQLLWDYCQNTPHYSVGNFYLFQPDQYFYGDAFCALTQSDYDQLEGSFAEQIQLFWSTIDEGLELYHFAMRITLSKKGAQPQDGQQEKMYLYAQMIEEGVQIQIRPIVSPSEQQDLKMIKSKGSIQFAREEYFKCMPNQSAREVITQIINFNGGMQKGRKSVTFCISIIEQMTRHKKVDSESKMLSESILAKQNGLNIFGMTIKAAQSKISSGLSWLKNLGNHKGK